ncbi:MAG: DMT family transporter [Coriobacteriia bacterium]|nr:DMT family transporter [Coriobacteriia bacterium]
MSKTLRYSLIMFAAGCCYGVVVPLVRVIYAQGISPTQVLGLQYFLGSLALALVVLIFFRRKVAPKALLQLLGVGFLAAGVSFFYYQAISLIPSATALTLLFQFVWMGVVVQAVRERTFPPAMTIISVLVIMLGTILATGVLETGPEPLNVIGVLFGFLSAVFYTAFLVASGKAAAGVPAVNRTLFTTIGSFIIALVIYPSFFTETLAPNLTNGDLLMPSLALGMMGILLPVFLIAYSAPHLPNGLATIMASSELPSGILCVMLFMGDKISPLVFLGVVIVLAGIVLSQAKDVLKALSVHANDKKLRH